GVDNAYAFSPDAAAALPRLLMPLQASSEPAHRPLLPTEVPQARGPAPSVPPARGPGAAGPPTGPPRPGDPPSPAAGASPGATASALDTRPSHRGACWRASAPRR